MIFFVTYKRWMAVVWECWSDGSSVEAEMTRDTEDIVKQHVQMRFVSVDLFRFVSFSSCLRCTIAMIATTTQVWTWHACAVIKTKRNLKQKVCKQLFICFVCSFTLSKWQKGKCSTCKLKCSCPKTLSLKWQVTWSVSLSLTHQKTSVKRRYFAKTCVFPAIIPQFKQHFNAHTRQGGVLYR